jgi:hypothetical protein
MTQAPVATWPNSTAKTLAVLISLAGVSVLFGWVLDAAWLKTGLPGLPKMSPLMASLFVLTGLALYIATRQISDRPETRHGLKSILP